MNMIVRTHQINHDVLNVLATAECSGQSLRLTGQLDRKLYLGSSSNEVGNRSEPVSGEIGLKG